MIERRKSKVVFIGNSAIGGNNPIAIQSMTNTDTRDVPATVRQINELYEKGCEIIRVAVSDMAAAKALKNIKQNIPKELPLVADIHFDYRLALAAIKNGTDKLRINPGNIGNIENIKKVVFAAKEKNIPIRIGVNAGSLEKDLFQKYKKICAEALCESVFRNVKILENFDFDNIVIAVKSSSAVLSIEAYEAVALRCDYPLHVGITESGPSSSGIIKSSVGIGTILSKGIGDTIRVSLTDNPIAEVNCAKKILQALEIRRFGAEVISCPTCGRTEIDIIKIANEVEEHCRDLPYHIKIAVMGCVVNGPGEARDADIGIACGKDSAVLFKKGQIIKTVSKENIINAIFSEIASHK